MAAEDFKAMVSIQPSPQSIALQHARQEIVNQARARNLTPLDMVYVDVKDPAGLEKECEEGRDWGMGGKWCIHPTQVEIVNRVFGKAAAAKPARYSDIEWS
jgi:citrate lyase beta subunit